MVLFICGLVSVFISLMLVGVAVALFVFDRKEVKKAEILNERTQTLNSKIQQINEEIQSELSSNFKTQSNYGNNESSDCAES